MSKVSFFYANGTAYLFNWLETGFNTTIGGEWRIGDRVINPITSLSSATLEGLNGQLVPFDGAPHKDPFPFMLNPDVWDAVKIVYPASTLGMGPSIDYGVNATVKLIQALKPGTPFAIGGYSQGAAVMSGVYNQIKGSTGALYSRRNDFLGGVCFGNPRRQVNFRGEIGGTWSGAWDVANSTNGGHGSFPATGPYARLSGCDPTKWIEFTAPKDIFSSTGDTSSGTYWTQGNDYILGRQPFQYAAQLVTSALAGIIGISNPIWTAITKAMAIGNGVNYLVDALDKVGEFSGAGHVTYPFLGPPNTNGTYNTTSIVDGGKTYLKPVGDTCYQMALQWLEDKALAYATSPVVLGTNSTGWSTTLVPPES